MPINLPHRQEHLGKHGKPQGGGVYKFFPPVYRQRVKDDWPLDDVWLLGLLLFGGIRRPTGL